MQEKYKIFLELINNSEEESTHQRVFNLKDGLYDIKDFSYVSINKDLYELRDLCTEQILIKFVDTLKVNSQSQNSSSKYYQNILDQFNKLLDYLSSNPDKIWVGNAYQSGKCFFFKEEPIRFAHCGYNHGVCDIITDCPKNLLLLAEDD